MLVDRSAEAFGERRNIFVPFPGRILGLLVPLSVTRHSMIVADGRSSTRIRPPLSRKAWRAEFVMSSDMMSPSRQHRSESIWNVRSTSNSLMPFASSFAEQIARQSCRK